MIDEKVYISGAPRFRPIKQSHKDFIRKRMRKQYGKYVLMNSNFGQSTSNSLSSTFSREIWKDIYEIIDYEISELKTLETYLDIIKFLEKNLDDDFKILIKVHPAEDIRYYYYLEKLFKKVFIVGKTSLPISDFILGSIFSISTRCTTSIESKILNTPSISVGHKLHKRDNIPINDPKLNIYDLKEFKKAFKLIYLDEKNLNKNKINNNKLDNKSNLDKTQIFEASSLSPLKMLEENIFKIGSNNYEKDQAINSMKSFYSENDTFSKGTILIILYIFFASFLLKIKDKIRFFILKKIGRIPKRQLKFSNLITSRMLEELYFYGENKEFNVLNIFGQIAIVFKNKIS